MNTMIRKLGCWLTPVLFACSTTALAQAKVGDYPSKPIRYIIGVTPGGGAEFVARITSKILTDEWGQNVVVDPRPGGGGVIASRAASQAAPDGYTLYQNGFGILLQGATGRVGFDVLKAFVPVVRLTSQPYILLVQNNMPVKSIKDLIQFSQSKPLTYAGSSGIGSTVHLGMERLAILSKMKVKLVPYKGVAPAIRAVMGGEIQMAAGSAMSAIAAMGTGKVRALAALGPKRIPVLPDLPTVAEQGFPDFSITNSYNVWTQTGTPQPIIDALNRVISKGMNSPEVEKTLAASGSEGVDPISPKDLKTIIHKDYAEIQQMVKQLGLKF
jgi:tripartite-type tricarboxylate transporter receptor subunit TctC